MARKNTFVGFATGLLVGAMATLVLNGGQDVASAKAQTGEQAEQKPGPVIASQRYQISAWAHPGAYGAGFKDAAASHGAYVLDTQDGQMWQIKEGGKPIPLGRVRESVR
jgi:hypothetical protein